MRRVALGLCAMLLVLGAVPAVAQTTSEIADGVERDGFYVSRDVDEPLDLDTLADTNPSFGYVALVDTPTRGARGLASDLLAATGRSTIIVVTAVEVAVESVEFGDGDVQRALDYSAETPGASYFDEFDQVTTGLVGGQVVVDPGPSEPAPDLEAPTSPLGIPGWFVLVIFGVVIVGVALVNGRNDREDEELEASRMESARQEIRGQMAVIANEILEFSDRVGTDDHPEAVAHFRSASETYDDAEEELALATTRKDLEELSDELDIARWELAAAEAIVTGVEVPERPSDDVPQACFFDPMHGAGVRQAELRTPAGTGSIWVCQADYDKLQRGEQPEPREIDVEGTKVPAPQAPRDHGGGGFDWLDAFSILVGGMARDYRWRRPPGRVRTPAGGSFGLPFPGGFGGGGPSTSGGRRGRSFGGGGSAVRAVGRSMGGGGSRGRSGGGSRRR